MVTQIVAGRVFDYSHCIGRGAVSGIGFNSVINLAMSSDGKTYVVNRGQEAISGVDWSKTARGARVGVFRIGSNPGAGDTRRPSVKRPKGRKPLSLRAGKPVAITVTRMREPISSSVAWPNLILASGLA